MKKPRRRRRKRRRGKRKKRRPRETSRFNLLPLDCLCRICNFSSALAVRVLSRKLKRVIDGVCRPYSSYPKDEHSMAGHYRIPCYINRKTPVEFDTLQLRRNENNVIVVSPCGEYMALHVYSLGYRNTPAYLTMVNTRTMKRSHIYYANDLFLRDNPINKLFSWSREGITYQTDCKVCTLRFLTPRQVISSALACHKFGVNIPELFSHILDFLTGPTFEYLENNSVLPGSYSSVYGRPRAPKVEQKSCSIVSVRGIPRVAEGLVRNVVFSPSGKLACVVQYNRLVLRSMPTWKKLATLNFDFRIGLTASCFHPHKPCFVVYGVDLDYGSRALGHTVCIYMVEVLNRVRVRGPFRLTDGAWSLPRMVRWSHSGHYLSLDVENSIYVIVFHNRALFSSRTIFRYRSAPVAYWDADDQLIVAMNNSHYKLELSRYDLRGHQQFIVRECNDDDRMHW